MPPQGCFTTSILIILCRLVAISQSEVEDVCPSECICLSQTQVLCNSGGLHSIPLKLLPLTVEHLSLTRNNFSIIKSDAFAGLKHLRKLHLDGNNISTIKPFAFRGLPRLKELSIQQTPLTTVPRFSFAGLQNLTSINLSHNRITQVESYAFAGTTNLKIIVLTNNPIVKLESNAFSGLISVERLNFPSGIRIIEPDAFSGLDTVEHLKLSFMDLPGVDASTFRGLTNIGVFSIQESDLGVIDSEAFDGVTNIKTMNFVNNKIDAILGMNISQDHNIGTLKFNGNHILDIPRSETLNIVVHKLVMKSNHFPCNCLVKNLLEGPLVNGSIPEFLSENYCISPLDMNGRLMSYLDFDRILKCQEDVTRESFEASRESSSGKSNKDEAMLCFVYVIFLFLRKF